MGIDSFFGIGLPELAVILILAGIVMGPQRIAQAARWLGKTTAQLQAISRGFMAQLQDEIDSMEDGTDLKEMLNEMKSLQNEVNVLRQQVSSTASSAMDELSGAAEEIKKTKDIVENSIAPPKLPSIVDSDEAEVEPAPNGHAPPPKLPNIIDIPDDPE